MLDFEVVSDREHPLVPVARALFEDYARELNIDLCFQGFQDELEALPGKYGPPRGALFVVKDSGQPIACGALRPLDDDTCELKRIYIEPAHRGYGFGRQITQELLNIARTAGYKIAKLDTLRRLVPACNLYKSLGFVEIEPYNFNPEHDIVYLQLEL